MTLDQKRDENNHFGGGYRPWVAERAEKRSKNGIVPCESSKKHTSRELDRSMENSEEKSGHVGIGPPLDVASRQSPATYSQGWTRHPSSLGTSRFCEVPVKRGDA